MVADSQKEAKRIRTNAATLGWESLKVVAFLWDQFFSKRIPFAGSEETSEPAAMSLERGQYRRFPSGLV
jgi:hypothetical protein